jgi:hypothetical protein
MEQPVETKKRVVKRLGGSEATVNIFWYYRRLTAMGYGEIAWRIRRVLWQIVARFLHRRWERQYHSSADSHIAPDAVDKIRFYGLSDIKSEDVPRNWVESTVAAADELLLHRYGCFALCRLDLGKEISWNREYKRGIDTPLLFGPWMDYRDTESYGDFKYFWELPRFQHLITLAKAYCLTGKEEYAKEVVTQIDGFVRQSPYLLGVNWIMPMEASIRLISVGWITVFLREYLKKNAQACVLIGRLVRSHVDYITKNYAAYSSANNHLIAEAAGVFIAAICFGNLKGIRNNRDKAYQILCEEIIRQNYEDGVNKEQAVHYQILAFNFLLLAGLLGRANGVEFPDQYWKMLEKQAAFLAAIADDNCLLPEIGDSDDGRAVLLSETDSNPVQSILATSSVLFNRADFKARAGYFDETSFWLLGREGQKQFDDIKNQSATTDQPARFEQGGYYVLTEGNSAKVKIVFDCGPLGFGAIAAHGHADSLSFTLGAYNLPFFIDPGTYTYIATDSFRNYFRSTAAHNTVVIDSENQSDIAGPFLWTKKANSFVQEWEDNDRHIKIVGWHDGYCRLSDPVIHRRSIDFDKGNAVVVIMDFIESNASHMVEQYFHFAPECVVERLSENRFRIISGSDAVELLTDENTTAKIVSASESPISGWASRSYDMKEPITTIICRTTCAGNRYLTTRIRLSIKD